MEKFNFLPRKENDKKTKLTTNKLNLINSTTCHRSKSYRHIKHNENNLNFCKMPFKLNKSSIIKPTKHPHVDKCSSNSSHFNRSYSKRPLRLIEKIKKFTKFLGNGIQKSRYQSHFL